MVCWIKFWAGCTGLGVVPPSFPVPDWGVVGAGDCCTGTTEPVGSGDSADTLDPLLATFRRASATHRSTSDWVYVYVTFLLVRGKCDSRLAVMSLCSKVFEYTVEVRVTVTEFTFDNRKCIGVVAHDTIELGNFFCLITDNGIN